MAKSSSHKSRVENQAMKWRGRVMTDDARLSETLLALSDAVLALIEDIEDLEGRIRKQPR